MILCSSFITHVSVLKMNATMPQYYKSRVYHSFTYTKTDLLLTHTCGVRRVRTPSSAGPMPSRVCVSIFSKLPSFRQLNGGGVTCDCPVLPCCSTSWATIRSAPHRRLPVGLLPLPHIVPEAPPSSHRDRIWQYTGVEREDDGLDIMLDGVDTKESTIWCLYVHDAATTNLRIKSPAFQGLGLRGIVSINQKPEIWHILWASSVKAPSVAVSLSSFVYGRGQMRV